MSATLLPLILALAAGPTDVDQVGLEQIGTPDTPGAAVREVDALQLGERKAVIAPAPPSSPPTPFDQVNKEARTAAAPAGQPDSIPYRSPEQLNTSPKTAEAPSGPAVPWPRSTTMEPVFGQDACDPQDPKSRDNPACARTLEMRASEFAQPAAPTTSAEERLMSDTHERGQDADASARRLATGDVQNSSAAQAYVFTQDTAAAAAQSTATTAVSAETQKAIDAATQLLGSLPANAVITPH
ncbi:hypothetical protein [Phenylobacterium sp.]|uniref:hypothetical protein n=1 Tax=Phenylobacterium sp. TaxID=1871053 RepID=UPI0035B2419D